MPVRNIPIGTRALTGQHARSGARYESGLERDFFELMTQDPLFDDVDWQPVHLDYLSQDGTKRYYTPDALVRFKTDPQTGHRRPPLLVEVKYREEYRKKFGELKERFQVARLYSRQKGWQFKVVTDREIRTVSFRNRHFLHGFRDRRPDERHVETIFAHLCDITAIDVRSLLAVITTDLWKQAEIIPTLWWLVAHSKIRVDMHKPLSMESNVSLPAWQ